MKNAPLTLAAAVYVATKRLKCSRHTPCAVTVSLVLFGALIFGAADRTLAGSVYYVGTNNGANHTFGTVDSLGNTTVLGTGLTFGGGSSEKLMFTPNGNLYAFDVAEGSQGIWGSVNLATGAFTQIGNLNTYFPAFFDHNESYGFSLAFGSSGNLYTTGYGTDANYDYGTLSLTTGAFTKIAASPVEIAGSLASWGNTVYYVGTNNGANHTFGTVDSLGNTTVLGTGLTFGGGSSEKLMFAPNGNLYAFDVAEGSQGIWGSVNLANGAFTQIGNLNTYFPAFFDHNESYGFSLAFGPSGTLYATGYGTDANYDYGTLSLTTGAFTKIAASPVSIAGSLAVPTPEPSAIVLLSIGAISLAAYAWGRKRRV